MKRLLLLNKNPFIFLLPLLIIALYSFSGCGRTIIYADVVITGDGDDGGYDDGSGYDSVPYYPDDTYNSWDDGTGNSGDTGSTDSGDPQIPDDWARYADKKCLVVFTSDNNIVLVPETTKLKISAPAKTAANNIKFYELQVSSSKDFSKSILRYKLNTGRFKPSIEKGETKYYRVRAVYTGSKSKWSNVAEI